MSLQAEMKYGFFFEKLFMNIKKVSDDFVATFVVNNTPIYRL